MIKRYDLSREYRGNIGTPAITEQPEGAYVLYDDYAAVFDELRAEKAGLEAIVAGQAEELAESRRILAGLPQDAIDGGWTAAGISAHAKALETENERLREALRKCIRVIEIDRESLFETHRDPKTGQVEDRLGREGLAEYDAILAAAKKPPSPNRSNHDNQD